MSKVKEQVLDNNNAENRFLKRIKIVNRRSGSCITDNDNMLEKN